jgi:hypothetical protein
VELTMKVLTRKAVEMCIEEIEKKDRSFCPRCAHSSSERIFNVENPAGQLRVTLDEIRQGDVFRPVEHFLAESITKCLDIVVIEQKPAFLF